jgi:hypothetical protein
MVKVYAQGDTSYTRAANMIRTADAGLDTVVRSANFLNELNLCDEGTQKGLRLMYKYYKKWGAHDKEKAA